MSKKRLSLVDRLNASRNQTYPDICPDDRPDRYPDDNPDKRPDEYIDRYPDDKPDECPGISPVKCPDDKPDKYPDKCQWMTDNQIKVFNKLNELNGKAVRLQDICQTTGVPYGSVRRAIRVFVRNGYIEKPVKAYRGSFRGLIIKVLAKN